MLDQRHFLSLYSYSLMKSPQLSSLSEYMIRLCEPGGISVSEDGSLLYIADTNNHAVKALNLDTLTLHRVGIKFPGNYWDYWRGICSWKIISLLKISVKYIRNFLLLNYKFLKNKCFFRGRGEGRASEEKIFKTIRSKLFD